MAWLTIFALAILSSFCASFTSLDTSKAFTLNECGKYAQYQQWKTYKNGNFSVIYSPETKSTCIHYDNTVGGAVPYSVNCNIDNSAANSKNNAFTVNTTSNYTQFIAWKTKVCLQSIDYISYSLVDLNDCNNPNIPANYAKWIMDYPKKNYIASVANTSLCLTVALYAYNNCSQQPFKSYDYCNQQLPATDRVKNMLSMMTISEKTQLLPSTTRHFSVGVPRLGLAPILYNEALHGVAVGCGKTYNQNTGCATSFPHAMLLGSTFNRTLWAEIGKTISTEARAFYNQGIGGLFYWTPVINLFRDPRWGRGQEVPGEDPFLTGEYGAQLSYNMQYGEDTRYTKVVATGKHAFAYDQEGNYGTARSSFNANISEQDQVNYYWPPWRVTIQQGKLGGFMCSVNDVNSIPSCANNEFINEIARKQWGMDGYVTSDGGGIRDPNFMRYTNGAEICNGNDFCRVNVGLSSGCDTNDGQSYLGLTQQAYNAGVVTEEQLNTNTGRILLKAFELGMMDDPGPYYNTYSSNKIDTKESRQLSLSAAEQGIVLLKNRNNILPFKDLQKQKTFAFIGPHYDATQAMLSNYHGANVLVNSHSPYQAALNMNISVKYSVGCDMECNTTDGFAAAIETAKNADYAIVFLGLYPSLSGPPTCKGAAAEGESCDRNSLLFPNYQLQLLKNISLLTSTPTILVLIHAGPIDLTWPKSNDSVQAIVDAMYPGQLGGDAIMSILFGGVSPAGKLVETVYPESLCSARNIMDMSLSNNGGITYRYYEGNDIIYPFGYGLSYTNFSYQWQNSTNWKIFMQQTIKRNMEIPFQVMVTNIGPMDSDCVVLGFINIENSSQSGNPRVKLFDFQRVFVKNDQTVNVTLSINPYSISYANKFGQEIINRGHYDIFVGEYMNDNKNYVQAHLELIGKSVIISDLFRSTQLQT